MAAIELLATLTQFLDASAELVPAPAIVGVVEPGAAAELPAIVLSLGELVVPGRGLGERASVVTGALATAARIDLAAPVLAGDSPVRLLDAERRRLLLPHGGLVREDGTRDPLRAADFELRVGGALRTLVGAGPQGLEYSVAAASGELTFGSALPAAGIIVARYFLGSWERRVERLEGLLHVDVHAMEARDVVDLSNAVLIALERAALSGSGGVEGLARLEPREVGSVSATRLDGTDTRLRRLVMRFELDLVVDRPESSGGVIHRIPFDAVLEAASGGRVTESGAVESHATP